MFTHGKQVWLAVLGLSVSMLIVASGITATAQTDKSKAKSEEASKPKKTTRQHLMEGKLVISQELLKGVVLRDFERIEKNAVALNVLTLAEEWSFNNSKEYVRMSEDLRRVGKQLAKAAHAKDSNAATIAYQRMTLSCVECHAALIDGFEKPQ